MAVFLHHPIEDKKGMIKSEREEDLMKGNGLCDRIGAQRHEHETKRY
jgi:hypothetical protein